MKKAPSIKKRAEKWYELFNRYAEDLYPGRYTMGKCKELAELGEQILKLADKKKSTIVAHNYLHPEFHEIAERVGDSLDLSMYAKDKKPPRVDFESVFFMGATAKIITGDDSRVFVSDTPEALGCSLVFGTDHEWLENWKKENPDGVLVTYINSDAYTKSISDYISTSRNTDKIIAHAAHENPRAKILVLPDKYLGHVMKSRALELLPKDFDSNRIEIYDHHFGGEHAACYVHEQIGPDVAELELAHHPDYEFMIHPECGCASSCLMKLETGEIPRGKAYFLSTSQMVDRAQRSKVKKFLVATEKGMIYRLRKEIPQKKFIPVSMRAECRYMKANTFEKLLRSLTEDRLEIIICDNCKKCRDPKTPFRDDHEIHIPQKTAKKALIAVNRMMQIT